MAGGLLQKLLVVLTFLLYVMVFYVGYANSQQIKDVFYNSVSITQEKYIQEVSADATLTQILLFIILLWSFVTIMYLVISLCLPPEKSPVSVEPSLISISFLIGWMVGIIASTSYFFAFDLELLRVAFALLVVSILGHIFSLAVSYKLVYDNLVFLDNEETKALLWMVRALIHNRLSITITLQTYVMFYNLANVIIYYDGFGLTVPIVRDNITIEDGSSMVLALILVSAIIWFVMENFLVEVYCRYTFTVFPTLIIIFSGVVARLRNIEGTRNYAFSVVILAFCVFAAIFRVILFFRRKKNRIAAAAVV